MRSPPPLFNPAPPVPTPAPTIAPLPPGLPPKADLDLTIEIMCQMMEARTLFDLASLKQRYEFEIARLCRHPKTAAEFAELDRDMRNMIIQGKF